MKDPMGDKFKATERRLSHRVPDHGGFLIIRLDGKAFHTFTRGMQRPFDPLLSKAFAKSVHQMCGESDLPIKFAYTQSDEVSLLIDNRGKKEIYFGGRMEKILSVAASTMTAYFNKNLDWPTPAIFDARMMQLFEVEDVHDYFLWRKADANRNAISMQAQALFSHKELQGRTKREMLAMIGEKAPHVLPIKDIHFNGSYFFSETLELPVSFFNRRTRGLDVANAMRTYWYIKQDNKMLDTLLNRVLV